MASKKSSTAKSDMNMKIFVIVALLVTFVGGYLIARAKYKPQIVELSKMVNDKDSALQAVKSNENKVMMKEDKMWIVENGTLKEMDADLMMANGDKVMTDGTVIKASGSKMMMHNGEAIDTDGNPVTPPSGK